MFTFFEGGMRGGISVISNRFARANNPCLKPEDYDKNKPNSYICYLDANNLYGWAMSQYLPYGKFRFMSDEEIEQLDVTTVPDDAETRIRPRMRFGISQRIARSAQRLPVSPRTHDDQRKYAVSVL
jgi:hypothetical protein